MKSRHNIITALSVVLFLGLAGVRLYIGMTGAPEKPQVASGITDGEKSANAIPVHRSPGFIQASVTHDSHLSGNAYSRFSKTNAPKLTAEELSGFLASNHRSAASLLAAARSSGDRSYLHEAMEKFPNDPRVDFDAFFLGGPFESDKERRKWLDAFKESDPKNSLPNYLSASEDFKAGKADAAIQELNAASGKSEFQDYMLDFLQNSEDAYRAAGYSEAEAKTVASWDLLLPQLSTLKQTGLSMVNLANQYRRAGDEASAEAMEQMALNLGKRLEGPGEFPMINTLVGIAIQRSVFRGMDPNSSYLNTGTTAKDQDDQLVQQRDALHSVAQKTEAILPQMSDADLVSFYDRLRMFGEPAAINWAANKYGE